MLACATGGTAPSTSGFVVSKIASQCLFQENDWVPRFGAVSRSLSLCSIASLLRPVKLSNPCPCSGDKYLARKSDDGFGVNHRLRWRHRLPNPRLLPTLTEQILHVTVAPHHDFSDLMLDPTDLDADHYRARLGNGDSRGPADGSWSHARLAVTGRE